MGVDGCAGDQRHRVIYNWAARKYSAVSKNFAAKKCTQVFRVMGGNSHRCTTADYAKAVVNLPRRYR